MSQADLPPSPAVFFVAGEASGDIHGAEVIRQLRIRRPDLRILGTGGPRMAAAGQQQLFDLTDYAVVGLVEVAKHYLTFLRLFKELVAWAKEVKPEAVVLIDFPGFNLELAAKLRQVIPHAKLIYYISPQVWAWKSGRAKKMAKILDIVLVIFDFEKEWYHHKTPNLRVEWVGHPLLDRLISPPELPRPLKSSQGSPTIALLPGSRASELRKHFPILLETARLLNQKVRNLRFIWMAPNEEIIELGQTILQRSRASGLPLETYVGYQLSHLYRCDLALLASGSVSLECAAMGVPQIVLYKVNPLTYQIGRLVVKISHLSMVNILAKRTIIPEFVQHDLRPEQLASKALELLRHPEERQRMIEGTRSVLTQLGKPGASDRAARLIIEQLPHRAAVAV